MTRRPILKMAIRGVDVKTAGLKDLLIDTDYPFLKIKKIGSGSITYNNNGSTNDFLIFTHDLGYKALFIFFSQYYDILTGTMKTDFYQMPRFDMIGVSPNNGSFEPYSNNTELRYQVSSFDGSGGAKTLQYYYVVYYDPDQ